MTFDEMFQAVIENNASYDTVFFYAVRSTGIYCRPSCKSKPPKRENVVFYTTAQEASEAGYRPCKRCRSDLLAYEPMQEIASKLKVMIDGMLLENTQLNEEMAQLGLSRKRMVEVFKAIYGVTPSGYMNDLRFEEAVRLLETTEREVIDIAMAIGFSSLSAFYKFFKERAEMSPAAYRKHHRAKRDEKECVERG